jgi:hypothetical protein
MPKTTPAGVLRHARAHIQSAQFLDEVGGIVARSAPSVIGRGRSAMDSIMSTAANHAA